MNITYYGHACFQIECKGKSMLFDPFIRGNELAKSVEIANIRPEYILISHAHGDHTADAVEIATQSQATCVGVYELVAHLQKQGVPHIHPMNIGGSWNFGDFKATLTPAIHSSSFDDGTYGGIAAGFIVECDETTFYFAGDTALFSDMKLIAERYKPQFAFLPIGGNFTMDVVDAIAAAQLLGVAEVIGMHYDTFGYIKIDHNEAIEQFKQAGITLTLLTISSTIQR